MKIDGQTARSRVAVTGVVSEDLPIAWLHVDIDTPRTPRNIAYDYVPE